MMKRLAILTIFFAILIPYKYLCGGDIESLISKGIEQYQNLEYEDSINTLSAALVMQGSTDEQKIKIYQYLGLNYLVLGKEKEAEGAFRNLLTIDEKWSFDPIMTPPKVMDFFNRVKEKWISDGKPGLAGKQKGKEPSVRIIHKIPGEAIPNQDINTMVEIENPENLEVVVEVFYKSGKGNKYEKAYIESKGYTDSEKRNELYMVKIPGTAVKEISVDYFITVKDREGNLVAFKGEESVPLRIPVAEGKEKKKKKALLGGLLGGLGGAAVIGIVLGIVIPLATKEEEKPQPQPQPASVTVVICEEGSGC